MIKKIFLSLLAIIVILILVILIFLLTFDLNHYRRFVETQATNALGYSVKIGSMSTKLSLIPTINVENVQVLDENQEEAILSIPKLEAGIELTALLHGQITVPQITVQDARFVWTGEAKSNSQNKNTEKTSKAAAKVSSNSSKIWIDTVKINALNCKIGKEKAHEFAINKFSLKELSKFSFDIEYLKKSINVSGNMGSILELASKKENLPIDLTLKQEKSSLRINGKIGDVENLKKISFQITGNIPNLANFLKIWDIKNKKIPGIPVQLKTSFDGDLEKAKLGSTSLTFGKSELLVKTQGTITQLKSNIQATLDTTVSLNSSSLNTLWNIKPFELSTKILATQKTINVSDIQFNAGKSDLNGQIGVNFGNKKPLISGKLSSTYFDIYDIIEEQKTNTNTQKGSTSKGQGKILSKEKLPFDLLEKVDTNIQLSVNNLKFSNELSEYAGISTVIKINNNKLTMPTQVRIFGGTVQNQLDIDSNKKTVDLQTKANSIQLNKIKMLNKNVQNSLLNLQLSLKTKGDSLHALASSSNGNLTVELTNGQIVNKWFNSLPTTLNILKGKTNSLAFSTQDQKTELLCGALNMPIKNGILISQNQIALETDTLNFVVNGRVNLKDETLDLSMIPSISQTRGMANELLGATQAIKLTGPWTNITPTTEPIQALETIAKVFGQKLSGNGQNNIKIEPLSLCKKVLGRSVSQTTKATTQKQTTQKQTKVQNTQQKQPDLKQQLIQSISQALTDQVTTQKK